MTTLHLVRHGQTAWNRAGRIQGTADIPLNDTGREQAREAAAALRPLLEAGPATVVASDLSRARETAEIIADRLHLPSPAVCPLLRERSYGAGEGMTGPELRARFGSDRADVIPGAEPRPQLRRRAVRAVHRIARDAGAAQTVIVVSHGALIRELVRHITDGRLPRSGALLPNGGGYSLAVDGEGMRVLDVVPAAAG